MFDLFTKNKIEIPVEVESGASIIKASDIDLALSLDEKLSALHEKKASEIEKEKSALMAELSLEKTATLELLASQSQEIKATQQAELDKIESACGEILVKVLKHFELGITSEEKLRFSLNHILSNYGYQPSLCLIVRDKQHFETLNIDIPQDWEVKEDPSMDTECKLQLNNGYVECNFDAIFSNITDKIGTIPY